MKTIVHIVLNNFINDARVLKACILMREHGYNVQVICLKSNESRFTAVNEAFGASKVIKVSGLENIFIKRFSDPAKIFAKSIASSAVIAQIPRFALEALAFGGIILLILYVNYNILYITQK